jgi:hypothetical protein
MEPEAQKPWDDWVRSHIRNALAEQPDFSEVQIGAIAEFVTEYVRDELEPLRAEITELRNEIGALRADTTVLNGVARGEIKKHKLRGESS